jgi:putative methyltransferase (TIGR04325 family)
MMTWIKEFTLRSRRSRNGRITFTGDYPSWAAALRDSRGYDAPVILERTCASLLKVKNGEAVFERDSVIFDRPEYRFPVIAGLLRAVVGSGGRLCVADFGGSLGSLYFQCRPWLPRLNSLEWLVIEQPGHVACGRRHFEDRELRFFETMEACLQQHHPNVLLLSSVLQYLPDPHTALQRLLHHGLDHLIIDRTAFLKADQDRLTVQKVPDSIYPASYPAWFLARTKIMSIIFSAGYELFATFPGSDHATLPGTKAVFEGFICQRKGLYAP